MTSQSARRRLTMGQALAHFLPQQFVRRDGVEHQFFAGTFGIFGHGIVAGFGEGLLEVRDRFRFVPARNEQAMVHSAIGYAKRRNRLATWACTSSIGPGATNMVTGAATATLNRIPVLLLPGDIFANRAPDPVLQQLENSGSRDASVNDCFRPVSRYWDRLNRPEQLVSSLMEAMRVLTSPADTGAVTLAMPEDVQAEAFDYPASLFERRVWTIPRARPDLDTLGVAATAIRGAQQPIIIAGGGVLYSEATAALRAFAEATGIGVAETQAGKSCLAADHPQCLGPMGVTGGIAANRIARDADVVILVGTRLSDFTSASRSIFAHPDVRFIAINVAELDAYKAGALPVVGDARATLEELQATLQGWQVTSGYRTRLGDLRREWDEEVTRIVAPRNGAVLTQQEVLGHLNDFVDRGDIVVCAAGSLPGDLHRYWRAYEPGTYHLEYGYSCMGYEIAGGLGVSLAAPDRRVYVLVGDGSYLMMAQEIVTAVQEGVRLTIVLFDNQGFSSIGGLSESVGCQGFATEYRRRSASGLLDGDVIAVDFATNAASLGATVETAPDAASLTRALESARDGGGVRVIVVQVDRAARSPGYEAWWDVPVAQVSTLPSVEAVRPGYDENRAKVRTLI